MIIIKNNRKPAPVGVVYYLLVPLKISEWLLMLLLLLLSFYSSDHISQICYFNTLSCSIYSIYALALEGFVVLYAVWLALFVTFIVCYSLSLYKY